MTKYLVDYENVKCDGLEGISQLDENDYVFVFYSINADRITIDLHHMINQSKAHIQFCNVSVGSKNALDFQLATALGYLIAENKKDKFVIVTKDKDYSVVSSFWRQQDIDIKIGKNLCKEIVEQSGSGLEEEKAELPKNPKPKKKTKTTKMNKTEVFSNIKENDLTAEISRLINDQQKAILLAGYIEKYKTKLGVNNAIVKEYGSTVGGQLYQKIKPLISDKKGN